MPSNIEDNVFVFNRIIQFLRKVKDNKKIRFIGKIVFIIFISIFLLRVIDLKYTFKLILSLDLFFLSLTIMICLFDRIFMGAKWGILLKVFNVNTPVFAPIIATLRAKAFQIITPSSIGVDIYKAVYIKKINGSLTNIVSSIIVERIVGAVSSLAIVSVLLYYPLEKLNIPYLWSLTLIGFLIFLIITVVLYFMLQYSDLLKKIHFPSFIPNKIAIKLEEFLSAIASVKSSSRKVLHYYLLSMIEKIFYGTAIFFAAKSLNLETVEYSYIVAATPMLALLERIPISVAALGLREGLIIVLLSPYGLEPSQSFAAAMVIRFAEMVIIIFCLITWFAKSDVEETRNTIASGD